MRSSASPGPRTGLAISLAALLMLGGIAACVLPGPTPWADSTVLAQVAAWRSPAFTILARGASLLADWHLIVVSVLIAWGACRARRLSPRSLFFVVGGVAGAAATSAGLKALFHRPRPLVPPPLVHEALYSFPSGHALTALCLYGLLAHLACRHLDDPWRRRAAWAAATAVIALVGFSRVYLGAHFPSDVLAGFLAGIPVLVLAIALHDGASSRT